MGRRTNIATHSVRLNRRYCTCVRAVLLGRLLYSVCRRPFFQCSIIHRCASYIYVGSLRVGSFCHGAVFDSQCKNHLWQATHSEWHSYLQDIRCCVWHNPLVSCVVVHVRFFSPYGYKWGKLYR